MTDSGNSVFNKKIQRYFINLAILLSSVILSLLAIELFLRFNPKFGYIYQSFSLLDDTKAPMVKHFSNHCLRPSDLLGYENIPGCTVDKPYKYCLKINSYGMVGKEYPFKKENNTFRVLLLGDSIAWFDWSRQFLEEYLNDGNSLGSRYKFEIWNAAVPGYDVRRYALFLQNKGLRYKPDMLIIFLCMNDFGLDTNFYYKLPNGCEAFYTPLFEVSKRMVVNRFLMQHAYLYRFVMLRLENYLENKKTLQNRYSLKEDGRYYLRMIKEICQKHRLPLYLIVFPYLKPLNKYDARQQNEYNKMISAIKESGLQYLNLNDYIAADDLLAWRLNKDDEVHPSLEGHRRIAGIIYDYLIQVHRF